MPFRISTTAFRLGRLGLVLLLLAMAGVVGWLFYREQVVRPWTNDAYVQAHVLGVASQVSGPILAVHIHDNQEVKKGDLLLEIDPAPFKLAVADAEARLDLEVLQYEALGAAVKAAEADIAHREAILVNARQHYDRIVPMTEKGFASKDQLDDATARLKSSEALLAQSRFILEQARYNYGRPEREKNARVRAAEAVLGEAMLRLSYTKIHAPEDGLVTNCNIPVGTYSTMGKSLFAIVKRSTWWVSAYYRENFIKRMKPGQRVSVSVDMYPGHKFKGVVQGIGWGIFQPDGETVALLPKINPTVNWVRLSQRFPVRIDFTDLDVTHSLRIGASAEVTVDTVSGEGEGK